MTATLIDAPEYQPGLHWERESDEPHRSTATEYAVVEEALAFVAARFDEQPSLGELADYVGLSESHFQRMFTRWAGVSPKRFLQYVTLAAAKERLAASENVLDTSIVVGLSSPGRLHDLFVTYEAVTPGEYRRRGEGLHISYGCGPTPFGEALVMVTERGICGLQFVGSDSREDTLVRMSSGWERATFVEDRALAERTLAQAFAGSRVEGATTLRILACGTPFQLKVWEALVRVPPGSLVSYEQLAGATPNGERAVRAAASAVARNPIAYLIPCHRVIRKTAMPGGYRWGLGRKVAMLGTEAVNAS